ncbi:MAG TPA: M23 family metallopeptidase [Bacteroidales bacterium]|nr:M23 family metallopeptidase [Bacteroidales bacterium]
MAAKKKVKIFKNLWSKYRLSIFNEENYEEVWQLRLSRMNVIVFFGGFSILLIALVTVLIAFTPLREFIPGYPDSQTRKGYVNNALKVDSLERVVTQWQRYYEDISILLNGGEPLTGRQTVFDTVKPTAKVELFPSEEDSLLRMQIESDEMFNLSLGTSIAKKSNIPFFIPPVKGIITNKYNPSMNHYGIDLVAGPNEGVLAIAKGTVILSTWSLETGYTIAIQHEEGFLSVYKHNSKLMKKQGEFVNSGDVIAIIGNSGELTTGPHLHFELWHHGATVDPTKYIKF